MLQRTFVGLLAVLLAGTLTAPAAALTPQEKMETCKVGADSQKLTGAKRNTFIKRCMADENAPARRPKPQ